jgi:hypothetical protein
MSTRRRAFSLQRGHEHLGSSTPAGGQDQGRRIAVGVELAQEGLHDLGRVVVAGEARVEVVVAPVLVGRG